MIRHTATRLANHRISMRQLQIHLPGGRGRVPSITRKEQQ